MTDRPPTSDQLLVAWFADGPTAMPDRVVDVVADRIGRQRQRRSRRLRWMLPVKSQLKLVGALAAVLVLAVVGYSLLPKSNVGPPAASPSPTVPATPTLVPSVPPSLTTGPVSCANGTTGCRGTLTGGTYTTSSFAPRFSYTVPNGPATGPPASYWRNSVDIADTLILVPNGGGNRFAFQVLSNVAIPAQTQPTCEAKEAAGVGDTLADWVTFLTENPALTSTATVPVTIGGHDGFRIDFARAPTWREDCPNSIGGAVLTWMHAGAPERGVQMTDDQQESFFVVDVGGETVLITIESGPDAAAHANDLAEAQPIIDSFVFTP